MSSERARRIRGSAVLLLIATALGGCDGGGTAAPPQALQDELRGAIQAWNQAQQGEEPPGVAHLQQLRAPFQRIAAAPDQDPESAREAERFLATTFREAWEPALARLREETADRIQLEAQDGRLVEAETLLSALPEELRAGDWYREREAELRAFRRFRDEAQAFLDRQPDGLADLRAGHALRAGAGRAATTRAYGELERWFRGQRRHADAVLAAALTRAEAGEGPAAQELLDILELVETDPVAYLRGKSPEERRRLERARALIRGEAPVERPEARAGVGSGFYVAPGLVLTSQRLLQGHRQARVETSRGTVQAKLLSASPALGVALLQASVRGEPLTLAPDSRRAGVAVFALGRSILPGEADTLQRVPGTISGLDEGAARILFAPEGLLGSRGGPLVDGDGRWVGLVVDEVRPQEGLHAAVDGLPVVRWLEQFKVEATRSAGPAAGNTPPDARDSVVRVVVGE